MIGRHYIRISDAASTAHVVRSSYPEDQVVTTMGPLPLLDAEVHADSLNHNDQDDIRKYGEVRA